MHTARGYVFILDYGDRLTAREFICDLFRTFDKDTLTGATVFVGNNPYNLELYLYLHFEGRIHEFDLWLDANYNSIRRKYNYFLDDFMISMQERGYNVVSLIDHESFLDLVFNDEANAIFLFPARTFFSSIWRGGLFLNQPTVFISHSSKDKHIADEIFDSFQASSTRAWYDKYEIFPGDSITDKINEGLEKCDVGVLILSKNFFNPQSGWPRNEMNYFLQQRMRRNKMNFICINLDLSLDELPPLLQDFRYIDYSAPDALKDLIEAINRISS